MTNATDLRVPVRKLRKMLGVISGIEKFKWQLEFLTAVHPEAVKAALEVVEKPTVDDVFSTDVNILIEYLSNLYGELPYRTDPVVHAIAEQIRVLSNLIKDEVTSAGGFQKVSKTWFRDEGTGKVQLFDLIEARKVAISIPDTRAIAERLVESDPWKKFAFDAEVLDCLEALKERTPNFTKVIDTIMDVVNLANRFHRPINMTPILIVGEPGIGKSHFTDQLSQCLGVPLNRIAVDNIQVASDLSGQTHNYGKSSPGPIFRVLTENDHISPLIVLDELDKAPINWGYGDPLGPLHNLLEPVSAKVFKDAAFPLQIDASHVIWVATANSVQRIPSTILSRFEVCKVETPNKDQFGAILREIYAEIESNYPGLTIASDVSEILNGKTPREQRQLLQRAVARAIRLGDDTVNDWHVKEVMGQRTPRARLRVVREPTGYL